MITRFQKIWASIFIICGLIWFLLISQYLAISKKKNELLLDVNKNREILISLKENEKIKWKIFKLKKLFENKQNIKEKNDFIEKRYYELLNNLAKTDINWEWLFLTLSWGFNISSLIELIHVLWFANAKAISINNIRINSKSYFSLINDKILLNWELLWPILNFAIIWNKKEFKKYFSQSEWILKRLKERWINADVQFIEMLKISK